MNHLLLEYLIRQILSEEGFTSLNVRSFRGASHTDRTDKFVDALDATKEGGGTPLTLAKGDKKVVVDKVEILWKKPKEGVEAEQEYFTNSKEDMARLKADLPELQSGDKLSLFAGSKQYPISAVAKTTEFGGRGKGNIAGDAIEAKQEATIKAKLQGKTITLLVPGADDDIHTFNNVNGFERISGNKKADFKFTTTDGKNIYVQHKDPKHQQLAGVVRGALSKDKQVLAFVNKVYDEVEANGPLKKRIIEPITEKPEQLLAMYGTANRSFSDAAVQMYCIGDMDLEDLGDNQMKLVATKIYVYPELPTADPIVLAATYRSGRNHKASKGIIPDTRIGLYFQSSLGGSNS